MRTKELDDLDIIPEYKETNRQWVLKMFVDNQEEATDTNQRIVVILWQFQLFACFVADPSFQSVSILLPRGYEMCGNICQRCAINEGTARQTANLAAVKYPAYLSVS